MEKIGGRKFVFALVLTSMFYSLAVMKLMSPTDFTQAALVAFGLFTGANMITKKQ